MGVISLVTGDDLGVGEIFCMAVAVFPRDTVSGVEGGKPRATIYTNTRIRPPTRMHRAAIVKPTLVDHLLAICLDDPRGVYGNGLAVCRMTFGAMKPG